MRPSYRLLFKFLFIVAWSYAIGQTVFFFLANGPVIVPILAIPGIALNSVVGWSMGNDIWEIWMARRNGGIDEIS